MYFKMEQLAKVKGTVFIKKKKPKVHIQCLSSLKVLKGNFSKARRIGAMDERKGLLARGVAACVSPSSQMRAKILLGKGGGG